MTNFGLIFRFSDLNNDYCGQKDLASKSQQKYLLPVGANLAAHTGTHHIT